MSKVVLGDVPSENDTGDAGEVVVQACPEPRIYDLVAKIVGHVGGQRKCTGDVIIQHRLRLSNTLARVSLLDGGRYEEPRTFTT